MMPNAAEPVGEVQQADGGERSGLHKPRRRSGPRSKTSIFLGVTKVRRDLDGNGRPTLCPRAANLPPC